MSSIIKVQNIQYTDGDAALTIADGGGVTLSDDLSLADSKKIKLGAGNDLNVYHDGSNSYIEDTGTGDLHVKSNIARIRADQINLSNNANTIDGLVMNDTGLVTRSKTPALSASRLSTEQIFSGSSEVITGLTSAYYNSYPVSNGGWWDSSTSKFTAPTGSGTTYHYVSLSCLYGVTVPSSGNNYGLIKVRHSGTATQNDIFKSYWQVPSNIGVQGSMVFITLNACGVAKMTPGNYLQPVADGTNGVNKRVHSGSYTNFSVIQIG